MQTTARLNVEIPLHIHERLKELPHGMRRRVVIAMLERFLADVQARGQRAVYDTLHWKTEVKCASKT